MLSLLLLSTLIHGTAAIFGLLDMFHPDECCTTPSTTTTTTEDPCPTTNGYNAMGFETDDTGNVYLPGGNSDVKFSLIAMPDDKYWKPLAKDFPEADLFGSQFPDSPNYHGPCPYPCGCTKNTVGAAPTLTQEQKTAQAAPILPVEPKTVQAAPTLSLDESMKKRISRIRVRKIVRP